MIVLGLDQSFRSSGLVVLDDGELIHTEAFSTTTADVDKFFRAYIISKHIRKLCKKWKVGHIMIEGLAFAARGDVNSDMGGLFYTLIIELGIKGGYPMNVIAPNQLKKWAAGNGKADKEDMFWSLPAAIRQDYEKRFLKTKGLWDVTDAYHLAAMYEEIALCE